MHEYNQIRLHRFSITSIQYGLTVRHLTDAYNIGAEPGSAVMTDSPCYTYKLMLERVVDLAQKKLILIAIANIRTHCTRVRNHLK